MTGSDGLSSDRKVDQLKFMVGGALILIMVLGFLAYRGALGNTPDPDTIPVDHGKAEAVIAELEEELQAGRIRSRSEYRSYVEVRIREHDARLSLAKKELAESVAEYFEKKKDNIPDYAVEALTWRNRWTAFWDEDEYQELLEDLFSEHVMSNSDMSDGLTEEVEKYLLAVSREEVALADDVRIKMNTLPGLGISVKLDQDSFNELVAAHLKRTSKRVKDSSRNVAIVGGIAAAAAAYFGPAVAAGDVAGEVVAGEVAAGVVTALETIPEGLGKAISEWLLQNINSIIDELIITEDEVESSALRLLDDLKYTLMKGAEGPWEDYNELKKIADQATDDMKMRDAHVRMNEMRNSGLLGLLAVLDLIQERNLDMKSEILRSLAAGEE